MDKKQKQIVNNYAEKEKWSGIEEVVSCISHDIRNPVSSIKNGMYFLKYSLKDADERVKENMEIMEKEIASIISILEEQREFARRPSPEKESVSISAVIDQTLDITVLPEDIEVDVQTGSNLPDLKLDRWEAITGFKNIIKCVIARMKKGFGTVVIEVKEDSGKTKLIFQTAGPEKEKEAANNYRPFEIEDKHNYLAATVGAGIVQRNRGKIKFVPLENDELKIKVEF